MDFKIARPEPIDDKKLASAAKLKGSEINKIVKIPQKPVAIVQKENKDTFYSNLTLPVL